MSSETRGVKIAATREGVTITSDNPDLGEVREELEAEYNSEPLAIGFIPSTSSSCSCRCRPTRSRSAESSTRASWSRPVAIPI